MKLIEKWRALSERKKRWAMTGVAATSPVMALFNQRWLLAAVYAVFIVFMHVTLWLLQRSIDRHQTHLIRITLTDGQRLTGVAYGCPRCIHKRLRTQDTFPATDQFGEEHLVATARIEDVLLAPYDGPDDRFADATES